AQERKPHLTNQVLGDPRVDQDWARREGMVAFAGYPLVVADRLVGVMALFARHPLTDSVLDALGAVADQVALGIERTHAQEALRDSEALYHSLVECLRQNISRRDREGRFTSANRRFCALVGKPLEEVLGKKDFELYPFQLAEKYRRDDAWVMETGKTFET